MNARHALVCLIVLMALYGSVMGYYSARELEVPRAVELVTTLAFAALTYIWYYLDASERAYRRTMSMGAAIILVSLFAVPYYLVRSRPPGQRRKAVLRFLGFGLFTLLVPLVALVPFLVAA